MSGPSTIFEYLYRDAGNFKAFGAVLLEGELADAELAALAACFPGDGLFIAEQIPVPTLYAKLYRYSGGPTRDDHCWHEFRAVRGLAEGETATDAHRWGSAQQFVRCVTAIARWDETLSPHFCIGA